MKIRDKLNSNKKFVALLLLTAVIRIVFVLATQSIGSTDSMDAGTYHSIALNLLDGKGYSEDGDNPSIFVAPLFPLLLFVFYKLFGINPLAVELFQCLLSIGTGVLVFQLTKKYFSPITALIAAFIVLFIPDLLIITTFLYTETLFVFLFIALIFSATILIEKPLFRNICIAGLIGGFTTLARGVTILFPIILFFALFMKYDFIKSLRTVIIYSIFFILPILPWTVRNYLAFNEIIPIAVGTGDVLWTGNYIPFDGKYNYDLTMDLMDSMTVGLNQIDRDAKLVDAAKQNMQAEPLKTGWLIVRKFYRFWTWVYESAPTGEKRTSDMMVSTVLKIGYYPILLLFLFGLYLTKSKWRDFALLYAMILYYAAIHAVLLVVPRYRIPILPLLALFASVAIVEIYSKLAAYVKRKVDF